MLTINCKGSVSSKDRVDTIKVYSFMDDNIAGTFSNSLYGKDIAFENIMSLILLIEDCMNSMSFPRPMASMRKLDGMGGFRSDSSMREDAEPAGAFKERIASVPLGEPIAVFSLKVIFRTLSGWQGEIEDLGTGEKLTFKSDLELIMFMVREIRKKQ